MVKHSLDEKVSIPRRSPVKIASALSALMKCLKNVLKDLTSSTVIDIALPVSSATALHIDVSLASVMFPCLAIDI